MPPTRAVRPLSSGVRLTHTHTLCASCLKGSEVFLCWTQVSWDLHRGGCFFASLSHISGGNRLDLGYKKPSQTYLTHIAVNGRRFGERGWVTLLPGWSARREWLSEWVSAWLKQGEREETADTWIISNPEKTELLVSPQQAAKRNCPSVWFLRCTRLQRARAAIQRCCCCDMSASRRLL